MTVVLGVMGGGQLGLMLALAARRLGVGAVCWDPAPDACAAGAAEHICAPFTDDEALEEFVSRADAATFEFERVPVEAARRVAAYRPLRPGPDSLRVGQDRLEEKRLFARCAVPATPFAEVGSEEDLTGALERIGTPGVLKARRGGYDGKGQRVVRDASDAPGALASVGGPCVYEPLVEFAREISVVGVRAGDGRTVLYDGAVNTHVGGVLFSSVADGELADDEGARRAGAHTIAVMESLDHVGALCVEFFQLPDGSLLANETAPRVHNTAHWTIDGARASQFENHVRAVMGWPLGETARLGASAMVNFVGGAPDLGEALSVPGAAVHLYGKSPRPGRKVGHATLVAPSRAALAPGLERLEALARGAWVPGLGR